MDYGVDSDCAPLVQGTANVPGAANIPDADPQPEFDTDTDDPPHHPLIEETPGLPPDNGCEGVGEETSGFHRSAFCTVSSRTFAPVLNSAGDTIVATSSPFCDYLGPGVRVTMKVCLQRLDLNGFWLQVGQCRTRSIQGRGFSISLETSKRTRCRGTRLNRQYRTSARVIIRGDKYYNRVHNSPFSNIRCTV